MLGSVFNSGYFSLQISVSKIMDSSSKINHVIKTSLLLWKIIYMLANLRHLTIKEFFRFLATLRKIWILPINSLIWRHNDVTNVIVQSLDCVNQVDIGCHIPGAGSKKMPDLNRVNGHKWIAYESFDCK